MSRTAWPGRCALEVSRYPHRDPWSPPRSHATRIHRSSKYRILRPR